MIDRMLLATVAILATLGAGNVDATDEGKNPVADIGSRDALSGDWGGVRTAWRDKGLSADFGYRADAIRNADGGLQRGNQLMWQLDARIGADLDKLLGWQGVTTYWQILNDRGGKINERYTGSLMGVSNIEVPTAGTHIYHGWIQQAMLDERLLVLVGLFPVDSEFSTLDSAGLLLNPTFGASSDFSPTRGPSIFPISSFGTRVRWLSSSRSLYVQGALLDGVPGDPDSPKGTHIQFNHGDGTFNIVEVGYKPGDAAIDEKAKAMADPFDKIALGRWSYTALVPDLVDGQDRRSHGYYVLAEKTLYRPTRDATQGLAGFFRFSATDGFSTPVRYAINTGLRYQGIFPGRGDDVAVLGFARLRLSDQYRIAEAPVAGREDLIELTYRAQLNKWFAVQPVVQKIRKPALEPSGRDATIIGLRVDVAL